MKNRIQISVATYEILVEAGKADWLSPRADAVRAKGKGLMKTYWLDPTSKKTASSSAGSASSFSQSIIPRTGSVAKRLSIKQHLSTKQQIAENATQKQARLVNWIVDMLQEHIRKLLTTRRTPSVDSEVHYTANPGKTSLDEVAEAIKLPRFDKQLFADAADHRKVKISPVVLTQLTHYVTTIASMYHDNPFHNFEHACHVTMATNKFLKRIVAPDICVDDSKDKDIANEVHNYTHGINSDPITMLAIVFSALIHDADHRGVSNGQLIIEEKKLGDMYRNKSVAEQNSLDLAWHMLMSDMYVDLRKCLFTTKAELKRFRQVRTVGLKSL